MISSDHIAYCKGFASCTIANAAHNNFKREHTISILKEFTDIITTDIIVVQENWHCKEIGRLKVYPRYGMNLKYKNPRIEL